MRQALGAAARGDGRTHPNPSVGAVVFRGDRILGRGTTRPPGGAHAEVVAIERARRRFGAGSLRGASIAVTLEPCAFQGRTGPCTEQIIETGIARVVAGCRDPHPRVSGRGFRRLRRAGLDVVGGVLDEECRRQHRGFFSVCERGRPWLTLKLATTLDGRIATQAGESRWITGEASRAFVHELRGRHDAVMVGSETALHDDPELTVRREDKVIRTPIRLLLDGRLRVPMTARLLSDGHADRTWVVCGHGARGRKVRRERVGQVIEVPRAGRNRKVDLPATMAQLAEEGLTSIFLEGGGALAAAVLQADLVDEVHWMLAPTLIGAEGRPGLGALAVARLADAVRLGSVRVRRRGSDVHVHGLVERTP